MRKITVSSLPIQNVISDIAHAVGSEYSKSCGMFRVNIPASFGQGSVSGTDFDDGLALIYYDCTFDKDTVIEYSIDKVHPVKFLFSLHGEIRHSFINESVWHNISKYKNAIVASSAHHGHRIRFNAGERLNYISLELDRRRFQSKIQCEPLTIAKSWRKMLNDVTAKETFYHDGFYSLALSKIIEEWDRYPEGDWLRTLHLEGIAYKILVLQITQFQDDIKKEGKKTMLRKSEMSQMLKVVAIIDERYGNLPSINEIANEVGLNPNKLQQGFKEILGKTVNEYVIGKRLETARLLMKNTDYTLSTISAIIGYKNPSYFSKIFQEAFGVLPSEFLLNLESNRVNPKDLQIPKRITDVEL